jgi:hypothetical protein
VNRRGKALPQPVSSEIYLHGVPSGGKAEPWGEMAVLAGLRGGLSAVLFILLALLVMIPIESEGVVTPVTVTAPNGGEVMPSGSNYTITWTAPPEAVSFDLEYSVNGGNDWRVIAQGVSGTSYDWSVRVTAGNKRRCLVRVTGYDSSAQVVGSDVSDGYFKIEVIRITSPDGGESYQDGDTVTITWDTWATQSPITKVVLKYHKSGVVGWNLIDVIKGGNPGSYDWVIPSGFTPGQYRLKVNLWDANRNRRGADKSDGLFGINNNPPTITTTSLPSATENQPYNEIVNDLDGDNVTLSASNLPSWASFTDNGNGTATISGTASYDYVNHQTHGTQRTDNITITCSDGQAQDEKTLPLVTDDVNRPPHFTTQPPSQTVYQRGDVYYYDADGFDPDGDTPMFDATNIPPGVTFNPTTGVFDGMLTQTGSYTIYIVIYDGYGGSETQVHSIQVNP